MWMLIKCFNVCDYLPLLPDVSPACASRYRVVRLLYFVNISFPLLTELQHFNWHLLTQYRTRRYRDLEFIFAGLGKTTGSDMNVMKYFTRGPGMLSLALTGKFSSSTNPLALCPYQMMVGRLALYELVHLFLSRI